MSSIISFVISFLCLTGSLKFAQSDSDSSESSKIDYRLPRSVVPFSYDITLTPYLDVGNDKDFTFNGEVSIYLSVLEETNNITLHNDGLKILNKDIDVVGLDQSFSSSYDSDRNFTIIKKMGNGLNFATGNYTLTIKYTGKITEELKGFYRSSYKNETGQKVWLATTQFEPVGARRAFPCFDEPHLKATFTLTISHDKKYNAIANMPVNGAPVTANDITTTTFRTSPRMSTYLVAFVVSDFEYLTNSEKNFSVYAKPTSVNDGKMALEIGEALLKKLEEFTGIEFKTRIAKMAQIAIPDFDAGAMENWGLVTYREKSLLINNQTTSMEEQGVIETIAHEFGHQWFGDLVSPKWWKYVWLNEGFASFFESYITEKVKPEYRSIEQHVVQELQGAAFDFDSGNETHPMNVEVASPAEIRKIFDRISYDKAGSIIRMMQHFLTESVFQKGLQEYLKDKSESFADSDDLFRSMQKAIDANNNKINLTSVMDTWVNQKGYPVVTVNRNYDGKTAELYQERFVTYNASKEDIDHVWQIPINYVAQSNPNFEDTTPNYWMAGKSMQMPTQAESNQWIILNKQQTGFYRVNYDEKNWQLLIDHLNSDKREQIHLLNRAQLISDALAFVKTNKLKFKILIDLMNSLKSEMDYVAWYPGYRTISWLHEKLLNTKYHPTLQKYVSRTTKPLVDSLGLQENQNDEHVKKINRVTVMNLACKVGVSSYSQQMYLSLKLWLGSSNSGIPPNMRQTTLCCGMRTATFSEWKETLAKYNKTEDKDEKRKIMNVLSCSEDEEALQHYFNQSLDKNAIINDTAAVMRGIRDNSVIGVTTTLKFVTERLIGLIMKGQTPDKLKGFITELGKKITTREQLEKLKTLKMIPDIPSSMFEDGIKYAQINLDWLNHNEKELNEWEDRVRNGSTLSAASSLTLIAAALCLLIFMRND